MWQNSEIQIVPNSITKKNKNKKSGNFFLVITTQHLEYQWDAFEAAFCNLAMFLKTNIRISWKPCENFYVNESKFLQQQKSDLWSTTSMLKKLNSNCDKTQKLNLWQNSEIQIVTNSITKKKKLKKSGKKLFGNNNSTPWLPMRCFRGSLLRSCNVFKDKHQN